MSEKATTQAASNGRVVRVWDLPVRVFHWLLVLLIFGSWVTSEVGGHWMTYHMWIGYTVLALILFRVAWGLVGSRHARFSDFVRGPAAVFRYLCGRGGVSSIGHNPAGGWSVLALLASLALQAGTGLFANDEIVNEGPLAARVGVEWSDLLTTVHRYNFYVLLGLIGLHVAAVLFHLLVKRENIVVPMITGRKRLPQGAPFEERIASTGLALVVLALAAGAVALVVNFA